ncbi:type IV pilin PilA [Pseudanabaena sp. lw0831]|uniref:type IV pilin-like G/H family protein n=1 Tax=Pseudanabaena sp. lw0831 TaxID=1357935 RepID=UPI001915B56E|nr:type IV pilin-like G/H family protein [Pseudanabaena sp. lw0831]GBO51806.1 type IV pilin PilA [Pseudanabaena sp. lw0831]
MSKLNYVTKVFASLAIAISINIGYSATSKHHIPDAIAAENTPVSVETKQLIERLTGQWQLAPSVSNTESLNFIFTADGKLYIVSTSQKSALALEYQVNTNNGQIYLDVLQGGFASRTILDFSQKGQLILQQLVIPAVFQYSSPFSGGFFLPNALFLNRISNDTSLPKDLEIIPLQSGVSSARQSEAKTYVGSMNRAQQAFFLEKNYFAGNLETLQVGIPSETANYKYQIIVLDSTKAVQNIAIAKSDGLKSYTGLVYLAKTPNDPEPYTTTILCESLTATRQSPPKFILKPLPDCPSGYEKIN